MQRAITYRAQKEGVSPSIAESRINRSPDTQMLAERFTAGLRLADVAVGPKPNVLLYVSGSMLGDASGHGGGASRTYRDMSVFNGGKTHALPSMPSGQLSAAQTPPRPPTLFIKVQATVTGATRVAWVATIQCQRTGPNDGLLATELGQLVGGILGKRVESAPL